MEKNEATEFREKSILAQVGANWQISNFQLKNFKIYREVPVGAKK